MSTVLIHDLAEAYEQLRLPTRLAVVNTESSMYLTRLERGAVEKLNEAFTHGKDPAAGIFWIDDENFHHESG